MKKGQNLHNKNIHSKNISGKPLPPIYITSSQQSPYRNNFHGRSPDQKIHENSHKIDIVDQTVKTINIETIIKIIKLKEK